MSGQALRQSVSQSYPEVYRELREGFYLSVSSDYYYSCGQVPETFRYFDNFAKAEPVLGEAVLLSFAPVWEEWIVDLGRIKEQKKVIGKNLLLVGPHGVGKSVLAALSLLSACQIVSVPPDPLWLRAHDYVSTMRLGGERGYLLREQIEAASVLVLDDIGSESPTAFSSEQLSLLLDVRYGTARPSIYTTNLDMEVLKSRYDERIFSRLTRNVFTARLPSND